MACAAVFCDQAGVFKEQADHDLKLLRLNVQGVILRSILGIGKQRLLRDSLLDERADALCKLLEQFRVEDVEPAPGFYGRVLDQIATRQESARPSPTYTRFTLRLPAICLWLTSLALFVVIRSQPVAPRDYPSAILQLTSTRAEEQRDAVLTLFLAYSSVPSPSSSIRRIEDPIRP